MIYKLMTEPFVSSLYFTGEETCVLIPF